MKKPIQLESKLTRMIELLAKSKKEHWEDYFTTALDLLKEGKISKAKKRIRSAYGGMGSFNDTNFNYLSGDEYAEAMKLSNELYDDSESEGLMSRIFK